VLLGLVLAGIGALAALPFLTDGRSRGRVPDDASLAAAVTAIRAEFRTGDAVRVEPSWWVLPWHGLEGMGGGTDAPFRALLGSEDFDPVEAFSFRRLFVLAGFGREPNLPEELGGAGRSFTEIHRSETMAVGRWELAIAPRLRTLTSEWEKLIVKRSFAPGEALARCTLGGEKHRCGRDSWLDVAIEGRVVWRREVHWLFVHPGPPGAVLEVTWPGLPRATEGAPTWLYVRMGPSLEAVRHAEGKEVSVTVLVDGVARDRFALAPHRFWMERRAMVMPPGNGMAEVTFQVSTEDAAWRETMLEADVLGSLPEALRRWATHVVE